MHYVRVRAAFRDVFLPLSERFNVAHLRPHSLSQTHVLEGAPHLPLRPVGKIHAKAANGLDGFCHCIAVIFCIQIPHDMAKIQDYCSVSKFL